jgi:hypothetical protein
MGTWDHLGITTFQQGAIGGRLRLSAGSVLLFRHDLLDYRPLGIFPMGNPRFREASNIL